ncbi:glycosyltransferase [Paenibacillus spongiae]|uniref:Glycosyltransferase n=1 Tax=Paenibacillus spongiae TaxID=2909671 RepID=A0ABY5SFK9_9BACL|nr:glycosyltransferase [Paenibacillus spongiae]UVI31527.1 glycosyltransferase [Paenibacillus spongiae]
MKKRLLFVTQYLHTGGAEKSLLTLLSELNYDKYEVDLLLFDHSGALFEQVPPMVNILPPLFDTFTVPLSKAIPILMKKGRFRLLAGRILASVLAGFSKGKGVGIRWAIYRHALRSLSGQYDVAISYLDFHCNYYVAEKVRARKKILYNHMDYGYSEQQGWPCPRMERKSFAKCDYIVTVADSAKLSLERYFPEYAPKMRVIRNRVSVDAVRRLAQEKADDCRFVGITLTTVARLGDEKGVMLALEACALLVKQGANIRWQIIGDGALRSELTMRAEELQLEGRFLLFGEQANPYPYMNASDIYIQPSKTEAHCIAVEEALALCRPVVVTDIPSFRHQIQDGETGIIVPVSPEGIAEGIMRLIANKELREGFTKRLFHSGSRHQQELARFYQLIEGEEAYYEKAN